MLEYAIFAVTVIVCLVVSVLYLYPGSKKITTIPGPDAVDEMEGNFPDIRSSGSLHEFLQDIHEQYGKIAAFWWGRSLTVSIASPDLFKEQLRLFDRPVELFQAFEELIGPGSIQYANGAEGRRRHQACARVYSHEAMPKYMELFHKLTAEFCEEWAKLPVDEHIPLREYMMAFSVKVSLLANFGPYYQSNKQVHRIRQAYDHVWSEMEAAIQGDRVEADGQRMEALNNNKEVMYSSVRQALANRRADDTITHKLVIDALQELDLPDKIIESDLITIFVASFHTTGLLLTWALYFIASHPAVEKKLCAEISIILKDKPVTLDMIEKLKYTQQVINETLRCSVLAPWAARYSDVDTELGGHRVPAGTAVIHALGVALQDPQLYPDPQKFDPERFSEENCKNRPNLSFEPFGFAGKRKCMGYRFANVEAVVMLTELLRRFMVRMVPGQFVVASYQLVTRPKEEVWVTLTHRKKE